MANTYDTTIKPQLDELGKSMSDVVKQSGSVIDGLAATAASMSGLSGDITGSCPTCNPRWATRRPP